MPRNPKSDENLKKGTKFNAETASIAGKKGGAAGKGKGGFNHAVKAALKKPMFDGELSSVEELQSIASAKGRNLTAEEAIGLRLVPSTATRTR